MSEKQQAASLVSPALTVPAKLEINMPKLLDLSGSILHQGFIVPKKEVGKKRFKELKAGLNPIVGQITLAEKLKFNIKVSLDYDQFVGPGFNFDVFQRFLKKSVGRYCRYDKGAEKTQCSQK